MPQFQPGSVRLMGQIREVLRYYHYSIRTEEACTCWIIAFIRFNNRQHSRGLAKALVARLMYSGGLRVMDIDYCQ